MGFSCEFELEEELEMKLKPKPVGKDEEGGWSRAAISRVDGLPQGTALFFPNLT